MWSRLFQQKGVERGEARGEERNEATKRREEGQMLRSGSRQKHGRGQKDLPGLAGQGNRDSFNSAYIFILNDRYPGQAWQARAKRQRGPERPGPTNRHHGATEFNISREAFFFMAMVSLVSTEMTSRSHVGVRRRGRGGTWRGSRGCVVMKAGESFIEGKGGAKVKGVSVWFDRLYTILDLFNPSRIIADPKTLTSDSYDVHAPSIETRSVCPSLHPRRQTQSTMQW